MIVSSPLTVAVLPPTANVTMLGRFGIGISILSKGLIKTPPDGAVVCRIVKHSVRLGPKVAGRRDNIHVLWFMTIY
jgi:hypothetical protein